MFPAASGSKRSCTATAREGSMRIGSRSAPSRRNDWPLWNRTDRTVIVDTPLLVIETVADLRFSPATVAPKTIFRTAVRLLDFEPLLMRTGTEAVALRPSQSVALNPTRFTLFATPAADQVKTRLAGSKLP